MTELVEHKPIPTIQQIFDLEAMIAKQLNPIQLKVRHYFANGMYAREVTIPANTALTGKIHTDEHLNVISQGDISVLTDLGMVRLQAPFTLVSRPGTKRVGYTHTDTVWTTFHPNPDNETNIEVLEARYITPASQLTHLGDIPCLGSPSQE